jgi:hypothetical protein
MPMLWQLKVGLYNKRKSRSQEPKPIAETLPHINVNDLDVPRDYKTYLAPNISLRYPFVSAMKISWNMVQFSHSDRIQTFKFKWIKTGLGNSRAVFICECGQPRTKLYFRHQHLGCRTCFKLTYASRTRNKQGRAILKAIRLRNFLNLKTGMHHHNRMRLKARITTEPSQELNSKRLSHHRIPTPFHNYCTRGVAHWM